LIEKAPDYCEKKSSRDILVVFFKYKGKTHTRNVGEKWCKKIKRGETLPMKSNNDESEFVFTWETEGKQNKEIGSEVLLTLLGVFFIYKGYSDKNKKLKSTE